jgi:hypothetical protein
MFRLDTLSCALTILSTVLVGRRMWGGLVIAGVNSGVMCLIGLHTQQFAFIPANLFCIAFYAASLRSWMKTQVSKDSACGSAHREPRPGFSPS